MLPYWGRHDQNTATIALVLAPVTRIGSQLCILRGAQLLEMGSLNARRSFRLPAGGVSRNLLPTITLCRVYKSKEHPIKLLVGNPESASLPLPGTGQREGGAFTEPFGQFE